jgi:hypothetical protein
MRDHHLALWLLTFTITACSGAHDDASDASSSTESLASFPTPLDASELGQPLTKAGIRALETWVDDATFEAKWTSMTSAPIEFFGGADAAFHADLATLPTRRLPGQQALCHGDGKFDNFGWQLVDGQGVFSNNDFDDAGFCPVAADALRYLVATDLWFSDPALDAAALDAYVATVIDESAAVAIDPASEPDWSSVRTKGLTKSTSGDTLVLGGEVQAATPEEVLDVRALAAADPRFPSTVLDVTRNVRTDGGSAGLRRFWLLTQDDAGTRTIIELKELTTPGTEFGRHAFTLDGPYRFDWLKPFWWGSADLGDHFTTYTLGGRFLVRDRFIRANPKPDKMTPAQITNMVQAEASILALRNRSAWGRVRAPALRGWLEASATALTARWRTAYTAAGGK